jgi:AraC-like DNA-binding protein
MVKMTGLMAKMSLILHSMPLHQPPRIGDLRILNAGYFPAKTSWIDHRFESPAVGLVVSGRGEYRIDDGPSKAVAPGTQFGVFPGPTFHYGPRGFWEEYWVVFGGKGVQRWVDAGWFFTDGALHPLVELGPLVERFREMLRIFKRGGPGDADRAIVMTERLLLEMYYSRASVREARQPTATLESVLAICHERFDQEIDFEALAAQHAMSYSHLRQQMRKVTGVPPHQYVIRLRCEAARRMLTDTDLSIKQIASKVGIRDPYTFSRTFRRCIGTSPGLFRAQAAPWSRR